MIKKKIFSILDKKLKYSLYFLIFLYFPLNFLEAMSLATIPAIVMIIYDPEKMNNLYLIGNFVSELNSKSLIDRTEDR